MTTSTDQFVASLLEATPGAYARDAALQLSSGDPADDLTWRHALTDWVQNLSAALRSNRPQLFAAHLAWLRSAGGGSGVTPDYLGQALGALRKALSKGLPEQAQSTLAPYFDEAQAALDGQASAPVSDLEDTPFSEAAVGLLSDLMRGQTRAALHRVAAEREAGARPQDLIVDLLVPVERELGRLWHQGEITVGEEHFGTRMLRRILAELLATSPLPEAEGCVVLAAGAGDQHDLGLSLLAALMELDGWRTVELGADVPPEDLAQACAQVGADVVVLSAALQTHLGSLRASIQALRAGGEVKVLVGGYAFSGSPDLWKSCGADGFAPSLGEAVEVARPWRPA